MKSNLCLIVVNLPNISFKSQAQLQNPKGWGESFFFFLVQQSLYKLGKNEIINTFLLCNIQSINYFVLF